MTKETYHVNEPKSNITWKILRASILFCLAIVMTIIFLKCFIFTNDVNEYGNFGKRKNKNKSSK